jgi:hypothetical protein
MLYTHVKIYKYLDKQYPNSYRTFSKTILNIKEDIQIEEFFNL